MNREEVLQRVQKEAEILIRLHRHGLYHTEGYQERKRRIKEYISLHQIDMKNTLDPISRILYQRYIE